MNLILKMRHLERFVKMKRAGLDVDVEFNCVTASDERRTMPYLLVSYFLA